MLSNKTVLCLSLILCVNLLFGQTSYWRSAKKSNYAENTLTRSLNSYEVFELQMQSFANMIPSQDAAPAQIMLPSAEGLISLFQIWDAPIMESELAEKYPNIRTFLIQNMENPSERGRLSFTSAGVKAYIKSPTGSYFIYPLKDSGDAYTVFKRSEQISAGVLKCGTEEQHIHTDDELSQRSMVQIGEELRVFRLAVSTTGEYSDYHGGTLSAVLEAIVEAVNQVNVVYENELAVRFVLIDDNDQLINLDRDEDPFNNNNGSAGQMLSANPGFINSKVSINDYDIGHVFATAGAGLASLRASCRNRKAQGVSGVFPPEGNFFAIDYVAHEIGHQLGSQHTFNNCGNVGQEVANFAYEPGSGSTIMAYGGLCGNNNVQNGSDDYFHVSTLIQISDWIEGNGGECAETSANENGIPTVDAGEGGFFIPIETPFELTADAIDPNGDGLTYCWEQYTLGPKSDYGSPEGNAPRFRSIKPKESPTRYFPKLSTVVSGAFNSSEVLPTDAQELTFQCTVRDNKLGGGAVVWDDIDFDVTDEAGPFTVTSQNEPDVEWESNRLATVTWDVANTDQAPVNCEKVNIILSKTLGMTFDIMLAENVDNDGSHTFFVPDEAVTIFARVMVQAADNIFFNVNSERFRVIPGIPSSVDQAFQNSIEVFPNPTEGTITLGMDASSNDINVELIDVQGRPIRSFISNTQQTSINLDVPSGIYFLKIMQSNQTAYKKVVVTK